MADGSQRAADGHGHGPRCSPSAPTRSCATASSRCGCRPGTVLREDAADGELAIGRTPLREAVKRLALENLVAVQPRRGTFVSAVEAADIVHITEVRAELEGYAAELAARRMRGRAGALRAERCCASSTLGRGADQDALMRFDERIHRFIWEASRNPYLVETLERYFTLSLRVWYLVLDRVPGPRARRPRPGRSCSRRCSTRDAPAARGDHARARAGVPARDHRGVRAYRRRDELATPAGRGGASTASSTSGARATAANSTLMLPWTQRRDARR